MGEEYIRVIPSPNFPFKTQRCSSRPYHNARTRPVRGGRRPVSAFGNINTIPGAKTDPRASQAAPAQSTSNGGGLPRTGRIPSPRIPVLPSPVPILQKFEQSSRFFPSPHCPLRLSPSIPSSSPHTPYYYLYTPLLPNPLIPQHLSPRVLFSPFFVIIILSFSFKRVTDHGSGRVHHCRVAVSCKCHLF